MFKTGYYYTVYHNIIENARGRMKEVGTYYENHHIIPKSMGGSDNKENLVALTAREHFICHYLLTKIVISEKYRNKMIYALFLMCVDPVVGNLYRKKSANYELARKLFSENHPTKKPEIKKKLSTGVINYLNSELYAERRRSTAKFTKCRCGCGEDIVYHGEVVPQFVNREHYLIYIRGDNKPSVSPETRQLQSLTAKSRLSNMSDEELRNRSLNSFGRCDHQLRGKKISQGKKGKKTDQQKIMGMKYANMSDEEFELFLKTKDRPKAIIARMTKLREQYVKRDGNNITRFNEV
jgi:hypothetical protein